MSFFLLAWRMFRRGFYRGVSRLNRVVWSGGAERVRLVTSAHFRQFAGVAVAVRSLAAASPAQPWLQAGIGRVRSPSQPFQAMSWVIGERPIRSRRPVNRAACAAANASGSTSSTPTSPARGASCVPSLVDSDPDRPQSLRDAAVGPAACAQ
ncbi:hypothetical protein Ae717Ps2_5916c [Pseudonocardia sp. Ae717_Ps2]|nr:hypothetical protein Ae717Ps2_5916c [Pseudonocardia sp. Ae717_Ps2]